MSRSGGTQTRSGAGAHPFPDRVLRGAVSLYVLGFLFHFVGHVLHGMHHTPIAVQIAGGFGAVAATLMIFAVGTRRRWAPALATVVGGGTLIGLAVVHFPPRWGAFSEPWRDQVGATAWVSLVVALTGAAATAATGAYALRRLRSVRPAAR